MLTGELGERRATSGWLAVGLVGCTTTNAPVLAESSSGSGYEIACGYDRVCGGGAVEVLGGGALEDGCLVNDPSCCLDDEVFVSGVGTECTFSKLRDAVAGEARLLVRDYAATFLVDHIVYVGPDRTAEVARSISMPGEAASWNTMRVTLKPPEFFEGCLQAYAEGRNCDVAQCGLHFYEPGSCAEPEVCLAPMSSGPERPCG